MAWDKQLRTYWDSIKELLLWVGVLLIIEAIDQILFANRLFEYGIRRGEFDHWYRIFFAPFLHDGWSHVFGNSLGLLMLGGVVLLLGPRTLMIVTFCAIAVSGFGILFFGKPGVHAGASGIVYGYFGFLIARSFYVRSWKALAMTTVVLFAFQGMLWGLVPGLNPAMSWAGHIFGALGGVAAAATLADERRGKAPANPTTLLP